MACELDMILLEVAAATQKGLTSVRAQSGAAAMRMCIHCRAQRAKEAAAGQQTGPPTMLASKPGHAHLVDLRARKLEALTHEEEQPMRARKLELRALLTLFCFW